ncbi:MAG: ribosome maturation factor RimP [Burkholderiales bacterium]|nr:ribosome maturation factor RimP [Burkholderiales bacterium]
MDVVALVTATVTGLGYELVEVERGPRGRLIRVFIDHRSRGAAARRGAEITVEDCEKVSRQLSYALTVENVDYDRLEVSSPGLDRLLSRPEDFERFAGQEATVKMRVAPGGPHGSRRNFRGIARFVDGQAALEVDGNTLVLDFAQVDRARLVPVIDFRSGK